MVVGLDGKGQGFVWSLAGKRSSGLFDNPPAGAFTSSSSVTAEAMVFMVHCAYQPGGAGEKAHLLQFLTVPETGNGLEGTLNLARKWIRLFRRGRELQVVLPDPSLLCRGAGQADQCYLFGVCQQASFSLLPDCFFQAGAPAGVSGNSCGH